MWRNHWSDYLVMTFHELQLRARLIYIILTYIGDIRPFVRGSLAFRQSPGPYQFDIDAFIDNETKTGVMNNFRLEIVQGQSFDTYISNVLHWLVHLSDDAHSQPQS